MDVVLIKVSNGKLEELIELPGKWQAFGKFHLKLEIWYKMTHSRPNVVCGYGGCLSVPNLPVDCWCRTFEAIGDHLGGSEAISIET